MKYIKVLIISIVLSPILVLAYSENIIPGGENIGIEAHTEGIIVVGFYKVNGKYIGSDTLNVGDTILKIEGVEVSSIKEMSDLIDKNIKNNKVKKNYYNKAIIYIFLKIINRKQQRKN